MSDAQAALKNFPKKHEFFVGIDSDGCAFDTMEIKHKECFIPNIIKHWDLQPVSQVRPRGRRVRQPLLQVARHQPLAGAADGRSTCWPSGRRSRRATCRLPEVPPLRDWIEARDQAGQPRAEGRGREDRRPGAEAGPAPGARRSTPPSPTWCTACRRSPSSARAWRSWSRKADMIVRLGHARARRWRASGRSTTSPRYARVIAGQEMGTQEGAPGAGRQGPLRQPNHILMIGDAPGDMQGRARPTTPSSSPSTPATRTPVLGALLRRGHGDKFLAGQLRRRLRGGLDRRVRQAAAGTPPWKT